MNCALIPSASIVYLPCASGCGAPTCASAHLIVDAAKSTGRYLMVRGSVLVGSEGEKNDCTGRQATYGTHASLYIKSSMRYTSAREQMRAHFWNVALIYNSG